MKLIKASKKAHDLFANFTDDDHDNFMEQAFKGKMNFVSTETRPFEVFDGLFKMFNQVPQDANIYYVDMLEDGKVIQRNLYSGYFGKKSH
jgi:hypothetical protein